MSTYNDLLNEYKKVFDDKETLRAFLFELCNEYNIDLYLKKDEEADNRVKDRFILGVKELMYDKPLNYVLGYSYFYGYKMFVNNDVLIPRFETEELVGLILSKTDLEYANKEKIVLADVGTGSGAIAIALKKEEPKYEVYASDISLKALEVAKKNAEYNKADISFLEGSMLEPLIEKNLKLDILVSNPPYIKNNEVLDNSVKDYEPHVALFGGSDGLKFYKDIFENALKIVNENGMLFFEMGYDLGNALKDLASQYFPKANIEVLKDMNNKDRMLMIRL